jgi:hypothetical protein
MGIHITKKDLIPDREILKGLIYVGMPIACQDGFIQVSFLVITAIANSRGVEIAAAVGITEKIITDDTSDVTTSAPTEDLLGIKETRLVSATEPTKIKKNDTTSPRFSDKVEIISAIMPSIPILSIRSEGSSVMNEYLSGRILSNSERYSSTSPSAPIFTGKTSNMTTIVNIITILFIREAPFRG